MKKAIEIGQVKFVLEAQLEKHERVLQEVMSAEMPPMLRQMRKQPIEAAISEIKQIAEWLGIEL